MIPLGSLPDILRRADQCRFCHLVTSLFRHRWLLDTLPNVDLTGVECSLYTSSAGYIANSPFGEKKQCHRLRIGFSNRPTAVNDAVMQARMDLSLDIQLLEEDTHKFGPVKEARGRRMVDTVDMELVKTWIALCEQEHGDACESIWWASMLPSFVRMVDVTLMSLVRAPSNRRYVALSYVWGMVGNSYRTTKANVESRAQPAGLDILLLPATISDSIHLTRALGERYLWVDALCIIQDSPDDKNDQINVMEKIYSGAIVTVIAAGGDDAHARLPGFFSGSRTLEQHIEVIQGLHLSVPLPSLAEAIAQTVWDTRGWTLQELLLSRRRLFFTKHQVYFECTKDVWCEDLKTMPNSHNPMRYSGHGRGLLYLPKAHPNESIFPTTYSSIVERYTLRHLTRPSDFLPAFTPLTNAMTSAYRLPGGKETPTFRYGMQIWNLNHSLLWQPRINVVHTRRMSPDTGLPSSPSWTWAGWTGAVHYGDLEQFISTTAWCSYQAKPGESLVGSWYIIDDYQQLIHLEVENIGRIMSAEAAARPRYMIPEGVIDKQQIEPWPCTGTLIFRTQCASFTVSGLEEPSIDSKSLPYTIFHILSDVCQPSVSVGRIILPSCIASPTELEFVGLSRSGFMTGLYDESIYGKRYDGCMLHVMVVKRVGGDVRIRERVGLGIIFEQAWLECRANVDIVFLV